MSKINKFILISLFFIGINIVLSTSSTFAEKLVSSEITDINEETNIQIISIEIEDSGKEVISPHSLVGGGNLSCRQFGSTTAECNIILISPQLISYVNIDIEIYGVNSSGETTYLYSRKNLTSFVQGRTSIFQDQLDFNLVFKNDYKAKVTGYLTTSYGEYLTINSILSAKFTMK